MSTTRPAVDDERLILEWLDSPRSTHGLQIFHGRGWRFESYEDLAISTRCVAGGLRAHGVPSDGIVAVATPNPHDFLTAFYGALAAGATPLPLALPGSFSSRNAEQLGRVLRAAEPDLLITTDALKGPVDAAIAIAGVRVRSVTIEALRDSNALDVLRPPSQALLQLTSGSTGTPRAISVTWANLAANIRSITKWLQLGPLDSGVSWLPLFHDMGLIGCLITPIAHQMTMWYMTPDQFVTRPSRWLECIGLHGARISAAPTFGYAHAARRVHLDSLHGMDFSDWRAAIVGAERIDVGALRAFCALLEPFGFRQNSFRTAYGLAEATLAVAASPLGTSPSVARLDWKALRFGSRAPVRNVLTLDACGSGPTGDYLVGSGSSLAYTQVTITDDEGSLPQGFVGEIVVESPAVTSLHDPADESITRIKDGRLFTGDAGFILDDQLYVVGRIGDSIKVRGRHVYVEPLEARLVDVLKIRSGGCVVIPNPHGDGICVLLESKPEGHWETVVSSALDQEFRGPVPVVVYIVGRRGIPRTTSGKPRRRALWAAVAAGMFETPRSSQNDVAES